MKYKYLSIIITKDSIGEIIQNKHLVFGKHKTGRGNVRPYTPGTHELIEVIKLPKAMEKHEINKWCETNKAMILLKLLPKP